MSTAINPQLRPLTLGEILDRTIQIYRHNFLLFAGVASLPIGFSVVLLIPAVAILAMFGVAGRNGLHAGFLPGLGFILVLLMAIPVYLVAYVYSTAGLTLAAVAAQRGEKLTIRGALASVHPRFFTYLGFLLLQIVFVVLIPAAITASIIGGLIYAMTASGASIATNLGIGFLIFLVGAAAVILIVALALGFSIGMPVCIAEQKPAWESLHRAWKLSKGTRGRIFVLFLLVVVLTMVLSMAGYMLSIMVAAVASLLGRDAAFAAAAAVIAGLLYSLASIGGQILLTPVSWIALVLFYYDQRMRKEGFDIEWMMQQAGLVPGQAPPGPPPAAPAPLHPAGSATLDAGANSRPAPQPDTVEEP